MTASINHSHAADGDLKRLRDQIRDINEANGWYDEERTHAEGRALLHSEVSEAFEAFRDHGFADATARVSAVGAVPKPEGVGSELADVLIRLLDEVARRQVFPWWANCNLVQIQPRPLEGGETFGGLIADLHLTIATRNLSGLLPRLLAVADFAGVDLLAETHRKLAYNRTRGYRHGGKRI